MFDDPRWGDDPRDRDEDPRDHHARSRHRDDDAGPHLGRGPSYRGEKSEPDPRDRDDARWPERDRDPRGHDPRHGDPRDVFMRDLNLPRGREREIVHDPRERAYTLRGSETRTLSTVGAFRVVPARDLRDHSGRRSRSAQRRPASSARTGAHQHRSAGRPARRRGRRSRTAAVTCWSPIEAAIRTPRQEFYSGLKRERELEHDAQVYRAYLSVAERLDERDAHIERVVLDYELKREYQEWLHERDREREDYDGHPDRDAREIEDWALEHDLPYFDEQVHFPDLRIEYVEIDGRRDHEDVEVVTVHYRGAHGAAVARSGFTLLRRFSARIGGRMAVARGAAQRRACRGVLEMTLEDRVQGHRGVRLHGASGALPGHGHAARRRVRAASIREVRRHRVRPQRDQVFRQAHRARLRDRERLSPQPRGALSRASPGALSRHRPASEPLPPSGLREAGDRPREAPR